MDLGLDKLVEMIERRFGKWAADGLLLIAGVGLTLWVIDGAISRVGDIWKFFSGAPLVITATDLLRMAVQFGGLVIGAILFVIVALLLIRRFNRRADERIAKLQAQNETLDSAIAKAEGILALVTRQQEFTDAILTLKPEMDALSAREDATEAEIMEMMRRIANIVASVKSRADARSEPQLPLDTEQKTPQ